MKITIAQTGKQLIFFPETTFRFNTYSPIFSDQGAYTFPFEIPLQENRLALGFAERLADTNAAARFQTRGTYKIFIESKHIPYTSGLLFVTPNNETYSCSLAIGEGQLFNSINDKLLSDLVDIPINMGSTIAQFISNANALIQQSFPDVDFNLPLMLAEKPYDNEAMNPYYKFINFFHWYDASPSFLQNTVFTTVGPFVFPTINNITSYVPCPFVFSILKNIINNLSFTLSGLPLSNIQTNQLMFITNKTIDKEQEVNMSTLVKVSRELNWQLIPPDGYGHPAPCVFNITSPLPYQNPSNILDQGVYYQYPGSVNKVVLWHYNLKISNPRSDMDIKFKICLAKFTYGASPQYVPWIYNADDTEYSLAPNSQVVIEGAIPFPATPGMDDIVLAVVHQPPYEPGDLPHLTMLPDSSCDIIYISDHLLVQPNPSFNLRDHLPEITVKTLLDDLKNAFGIIPFVQGDDVNLKFFKDIYASSPLLDLTPYLLYDYEKFETEKIKSFSLPNGFDNTTMTYETDTGLAYSTIKGKLVFFSELGHFYRNDHDEYYNFSYTRHLKDANKIVVNSSGEEKQITADIPEMYMTNPSWATSGNWLPCPYIEGSLVSPFNDNDTINYMLAFWRGMVNDSSGDPYPFATPTVYKVGPSVLSGINTGLRFSGDYGTYEQYLSDFVAMLNQDLNGIKAEFDMPIGILKSLRLDSVYTIKNVKVIIKSIDYETDAKERIKQPVTIELVKI